MKEAVARFLFAVMVSEQLPVPEHEPPQPLNLYPVAGKAKTLTTRSIMDRYSPRQMGW